jgi:hypothetical protein
LRLFSIKERWELISVDQVQAGNNETLSMTVAVLFQSILSLNISDNFINDTEKYPINTPSLSGEKTLMRSSMYLISPVLLQAYAMVAKKMIKSQSKTRR